MINTTNAEIQEVQRILSKLLKKKITEKLHDIDFLEHRKQKLQNQLEETKEILHTVEHILELQQTSIEKLSQKSKQYMWSINREKSA